MKITYLGTGAAEGVPAMYCKCEACKELRLRGEREYHTRSQLLIDGELGIDFPPDAYYHSLRFGVALEEIAYLLITHSHMDHFYAHDFILRGYKYAKGVSRPLEIFGNEEMEKVFDECTKRELRPEVREKITVKTVQPFQPFSFGEQGEYTAVALKAQHSKTETAYVYLVKKNGVSYLHLSDTGRLPMETLNFLEDYFKPTGKSVGLVTFDCTFLFDTAGEVSRHMGLRDNAVMKEELLCRGVVNQETKYVITHFSHNSEPFKENLAKAEKEYGFIAAYDGMEIKI